MWSNGVINYFRLCKSNILASTLKSTLIRIVSLQRVSSGLISLLFMRLLIWNTVMDRFHYRSSCTRMRERTQNKIVHKLISFSKKMYLTKIYCFWIRNKNKRKSCRPKIKSLINISAKLKNK
jgi:hypothetical protein